MVDEVFILVVLSMVAAVFDVYSFFTKPEDSPGIPKGLAVVMALVALRTNVLGAVVGAIVIWSFARRKLLGIGDVAFGMALGAVVMNGTASLTGIAVGTILITLFIVVIDVLSGALANVLKKKVPAGPFFASLIIGAVVVL